MPTWRPNSPHCRPLHPRIPAKPEAAPRRPRRQALPDHLRRVEHRLEPEDTTCRAAHCGQPMTRVDEDISQRLDTVPAEFFGHRHIHGKWTYRQEIINARSGVHTPRSTLARTAGDAGAAMVPLFEAHRRFVLRCPVPLRCQISSCVHGAASSPACPL